MYIKLKRASSLDGMPSTHPSDYMTFSTPDQLKSALLPNGEYSVSVKIQYLNAEAFKQVMSTYREQLKRNPIDQAENKALTKKDAHPSMRLLMRLQQHMLDQLQAQIEAGNAPIGTIKTSAITPETARNYLRTYGFGVNTEKLGTAEENQANQDYGHKMIDLILNTIKQFPENLTQGPYTLPPVTKPQDDRFMGQRVSMGAEGPFITGPISDDATSVEKRHVGTTPVRLPMAATLHSIFDNQWHSVLEIKEMGCPDEVSNMMLDPESRAPAGIVGMPIVGADDQSGTPRRTELGFHEKIGRQGAADVCLVGKLTRPVTVRKVTFSHASILERRKPLISDSVKAFSKTAIRALQKILQEKKLSPKLKIDPLVLQRFYQTIRVHGKAFLDRKTPDGKNTYEGKHGRGSDAKLAFTHNVLDILNTFFGGNLNPDNIENTIRLLYDILDPDMAVLSEINDPDNEDTPQLKELAKRHDFSTDKHLKFLKAAIPSAARLVLKDPAGGMDEQTGIARTTTILITGLKELAEEQWGYCCGEPVDAIARELGVSPDSVLKGVDDHIKEAYLDDTIRAAYEETFKDYLKALIEGKDPTDILNAQITVDGDITFKAMLIGLNHGRVYTPGVADAKPTIAIDGASTQDEASFLEQFTALASCKRTTLLKNVSLDRASMVSWITKTTIALELDTAVVQKKADTVIATGHIVKADDHSAIVYDPVKKNYLLLFNPGTDPKAPEEWFFSEHNRDQEALADMMRPKGPRRHERLG